MCLSPSVEFTPSWWHCVENTSTNTKREIFTVTILEIAAQQNRKYFLGKIVQFWFKSPIQYNKKSRGRNVLLLLVMRKLHPWIINLWKIAFFSVAPQEVLKQLSVELFGFRNVSEKLAE